MITSHSKKRFTYSFSEVDQFIPSKNASYQASKEKLIESLSHELRTPLTSILMLSQIIPKQIEHPEKVLNGLKRIQELAILQKTKIDEVIKKLQEL